MTGTRFKRNYKLMLGSATSLRLTSALLTGKRQLQLLPVRSDQST